MNKIDVVSQIEKLIKKTEARSISWFPAGPNSYRLVHQDKTTPTKSFIIMLQKQTTSPLTANYYLTMQTITPVEILLQVNTMQIPDIRPNLVHLYHLVSNIDESDRTKKINELIDKLN